MSYYEDLRDAVHYKLKRIHEDQNKTFEQIYFELNVTSKETIRKLASKDYWTWQPDLHTLEELRKKLNLQMPDSTYRVNLAPAAKRDLDFVADYFSHFDEFQCQSVLRFCEYMDSFRRHYENVPAAADSMVSNGGMKKNQSAAETSSRRNEPDSRKTD